MMLTASWRDHDDRGITLVELLIYSVLLVVVLGITTTLFISSLTAQRDVQNQTGASNSGQVALRQLERALRNATEVSVPAAHAGDVLVVKTRVGEDGTDAGSWLCRAWHYNAGSRQLRTTSGPATGTPVTAGLGSAVNSSGWDVALRDVARSPNGGGAGEVFGGLPPDEVKIGFDVMTGTGTSAVTFSTTVVPRPQGSTIGGVSCT